MYVLRIRMFNFRQNFSFSRTQQVTNIGLALVGTTLLSLLTAQPARSLSVTLEAPGTQESTKIDTFVIDFDDRLPGGVQNPDEIDRPGGESVTNPLSGITYTYSNLDSDNRYGLPVSSEFGGAGGSGRYITNVPNDTSRYRIATSEDQLYFGLWWSSGDNGNLIEFFNDGTSVFTFGTSDLVALLSNTGGSTITSIDGSSTYNTQDYYGNPNGGNPDEPFAFLNFYAEIDEAFDSIEIYQNGTTGRFESDNHTFSNTAQVANASVEASASVPFEFSPSLGLLLSGGGLLGTRFLKRKQTTKLNK